MSTLEEIAESNRRLGICAPQVMKGMDSYVSPVTEKVIHTKAQRAAEMREFDCMDARELPNAGRIRED